MATWAYTFAAVLIVSLISLAGLFTMSLSKERLNKFIHLMVSLAVGSLLGGAFLHLIPEIFHGAPAGYTSRSLLILVGILIFFGLEKFVRWRHCHDAECNEHAHHLAPMNLIGDALHNFIDGLLIAASFLVSIEVGIATTVAVAIHELPQEIGDFGVLIQGGYSMKKALLYNFLISLTSLVGAGLVLLVGQVETNILHGLLSLTAGGFIYIAGADLIPELHRTDELGKSISQFLVVMVGIVIMAILP
ncbi:MAG: ZIP family metal transporter [Fidelibacterota bacterium]